MNQSKFSLADVITLLTALTFGFVCFFGTNFYTLGNTSQSIILSLIIFLLLSGTALGAKLLKRTSRNFKTCFVLEIFLLVFFTLMMILFSISPFPQYFAVSSQKVAIQSTLTESIKQAENMFNVYEQYAENRENLYREKLKTIVAAQSINPNEYFECGFDNNGVADEKQIENKMFVIHADLFPTNHEEMKKVSSRWLADARNTLNNWWAWNFGVVGVVKNVESNSTDWLNTLENLSKVREKCEQAEDFAYNLSFKEVKKQFTMLGKPTPLSISLAVLAYLLMLLSWFVSKRHTKFPGCKVLFGNTKTERNEL